MRKIGAMTLLLAIGVGIGFFDLGSTGDGSGAGEARRGIRRGPRGIGLGGPDRPLRIGEGLAERYQHTAR